MKNILFTLSFLIILLSCNQYKKKNISVGSLPSESTILKINPKSFIPGLSEKLRETSGIIFYDNLIWTINDSGGENKLYGFDFSGNIKKEIKINDAKNVDWEDLAQDEKHIYIGDFGNNNSSRKDLKIYQIKKKDIGKKTSQKIDAKEINFEYSDQKSFKMNSQNGLYDCEAIVEFNDSLYLFTKSWGTRKTTVYKISGEKGKYKPEAVDSLNANGFITGADISPDKKTLALIGYKNFKPILWICTGINSGNILGTSKTYIEMDSVTNSQTEGICFLNNDSLLISCERSTAFKQQVFLFDLKSIKTHETHSD